MIRLAFFIFILFLGGCAAQPTLHCPTALSEVPAAMEQRLMKDVATLASAEMSGRKPGSNGHLLAQSYIKQAYAQAGLKSYQADYAHHFEYGDLITYQGVNLVGYIPGKSDKRAVLIVAHYDHLGRKGRSIFFGADDNASGVSALLEIARHFSEQPLERTVIVAAVDAEESGLHGSNHLAKHLPADNIDFVVNIDMIGVAPAQQQLVIGGTQRTDKFDQLVPKLFAQAPMCLDIGHDFKESKYARDEPINWPKASDHYPFYQVGYPYLYFANEPHKYYHSPEDTVDRINSDYLTRSTKTIIRALTLADELVSPRL